MRAGAFACVCEHVVGGWGELLLQPRWSRDPSVSRVWRTSVPCYLLVPMVAAADAFVMLLYVLRTVSAGLCVHRGGPLTVAAA